MQTAVTAEVKFYTLCNVVYSVFFHRLVKVKGFVYIFVYCFKVDRDVIDSVVRNGNINQIAVFFGADSNYSLIIYPRKGVVNTVFDKRLKRKFSDAVSFQFVRNVYLYVKLFAVANFLQIYIAHKLFKFVLNT